MTEKMGRRTVQTFSQRGYADGQQAHEKMLTIDNSQGNENQTYNGISPHTCQDGCQQKEYKQHVSKDVKRKKPSYTCGRNINCCSHYEKQYAAYLN